MVTQGTGSLETGILPLPEVASPDDLRAFIQPWFCQYGLQERILHRLIITDLGEALTC